jgi:hypothetical protein
MSGVSHARLSGTIEALEVIGANGGLDPELATKLAEEVIDRTEHLGDHVTVNFTGVRAISSGFANAFFLKLHDIRSLGEWEDRLSFHGLGGPQSQIMRGSVHAVRDMAPVKP